jgi:hypothetical protein
MAMAILGGMVAERATILLETVKVRAHQGIKGMLETTATVKTAGTAAVGRATNIHPRMARVAAAALA